jgi:hypothetical protein
MFRARKPDGKGAEAAAISRGDPGTARKLLLCQEISLVLGVEVVKMVCIQGKEPTFHMHTADGVVEFDNIDEADRLRLLEKKIAGQRCESLTSSSQGVGAFQQKLLDACIVREATDDEQFEGGARNDILDYLTETDFITAIEGQRVQDQKKPMIVDGRITVSSADLASYLEKTKGRKTSPKYAASMLNVVGARKTERCAAASTRARPAGRCLGHVGKTQDSIRVPSSRLFTSANLRKARHQHGVVQ